MSRLRDAWWTAAFLRDVAAGERPTLFKRIGGTPVVTSHVTDVPGRPPVAFDLYITPSRRRGPRPALVVTHGFAHEGAHDPRLQALCRRLARLGWIVMAPQFPLMTRYQLSLEDTDDFDTAMRAITRRPDVDAAHVGVLAFSFGAAPVLIGLTRESVRTRAKFALVFGGYFDLRRTLKYVLTGAFDQAGLTGRVTLHGIGDDRWKFLRGNLHLLPESPTRAAFERMLQAKIVDPALPVDITRFSPAERSVFQLIDNRDPDRFEALYAGSASWIDPWVQALSPAAVASRITTPLIVVHSVTDHKAHYSESLAMSRALPNAPPALVAVVSTFSHVDLALRWQSFRALRQDVLPGLAKMWAVASRLVPDAAKSRLVDRRVEL